MHCSLFKHINASRTGFSFLSCSSIQLIMLSVLILFVVTSTSLEYSDGGKIENKASLMKIPCPNFHDVAMDNCDGKR